MSQSAVKVVWWSYCWISLLPQTTTLVLNSCCNIWASSRLILICFITHFISTFTFTHVSSVSGNKEQSDSVSVEQNSSSRSDFLQLFQGVYQDGRHPSQLRQQRRQTHGVRFNTRCVLWHSLIKRVLDWDAPMASFMANQLFLQMPPLILLYVSISCWLTEMLQCYRHFYKLSSSLIRQPNLKKL